MNYPRRYSWQPLLLTISITLLTLLPTHAYSNPAPNDFNLQVTPSPLVAIVKPGTKSQLELKIHNAGSGTESLKIEPRAFRLSPDSTNINLLDTAPPDIASWTSFSQPKFDVAPGQWMTEQITLNIPKNAGFSYSFAVVISRQSDPTPTDNKRVIRGSLAVFTLINVDQPGAKSDLEVSAFSASKHLYEYLPTTFSVRFHNTGNTIAQPYGNIFILRSESSKTPLTTLAVNETKGYILPGTERTITASWSDGFPVYQTVHKPDDTISQKLVWDWTKLSSLRIGRYTAHLVAVYNQAGRDVPIEGTVSFWVIPWKILLVLLAIALLVLFALFMITRMIVHGIKRRHSKRTQLKRGTAGTPPSTPDSNESA